MHIQAKHIILAFQLQNAFPVESTLAHVMEKLDHDRKYEIKVRGWHRYVCHLPHTAFFKWKLMFGFGLAYFDYCVYVFFFEADKLCFD